MTAMKSDLFFLIHNYNVVPAQLVSCSGDHYLIMDASDDAAVSEEVERTFPGHVVHIPNTGHNLTSYFSYFADHYEDLPEIIALCKGNMIGRHVSEEYFRRAVRNTWFTYLYEEKQMRDRYAKATAETLARHNGKDPGEGSIASLLSECEYQEQNSSWYMNTGTHPVRYFDDYDALLTFVYKDPVIPRFIAFAPGGCYVVRADQIRQHGPVFYRNLNKVMNYTLDPAFPAEAYIVERMMPLIFNACYEVNPWMEDEAEFDRLLEEKAELLARKKEEQAKASSRNPVKKALRRMLRG